MRIGSILRWVVSYWFEIAVFFVSFGFRFWFFDRTPYAPGWDSYFYIVQIKSFLEEGAMHSSRVSLFYPWLLAIQWLSDNYELTYKLSAALLAGLFSLQMFRTSRSLNNKSNWAYLAAGYTVFSPQLTYFAAQYSKNLLGAIFLLWLIHVMTGSGYIKKGLALLANLFIHKLTAGLSIIILLLQPFASRIHKKHLVMAGVGGAFLIIFIWAVPTLFSIEDFDREGFGLTATFSWPSLTFIKTFGDLIGKYWLADIIICNLMYMIAIGTLFWKREVLRNWLPLLIILTGLTFPFLQWSLVGLSFRALMLFLILCPLLFSILDFNLNRAVTSVLSVLLLFLGLISNRSYSQPKHDPPYAIYRSIAYKIEALDNLDFDLIIGHKALAEYVTFKTGIDVLPWEPEYVVDSTKLWRICTGINRRSIQYYGGVNYRDELYVELTPSYHLVREDLWDTAIFKLKREDPDYADELLTWKNPHSQRPTYMMKYKKKD